MFRTLSRLVLPAVAFAVGTLPLGHMLLRRHQKSARLNNAHNIGLNNALRRLGTEGLQAAALDAGKGALAVALVPRGRGFEAALAAYLGHLYPPAAIYGDDLPRGRGEMLLLGALLALEAERGGVFARPLLTYAAALAATRINAAALIAAMVALSLDRDNARDRQLAWLLTAAVAWRFKENIGRALDGTEPRLGEAYPVAGSDPDTVVAAFMIHPLRIADFWATGSRRFAWLGTLYRLGLVPDGLIREVALRMRPMKIGELRNIKTKTGKNIRCMLISAPLLPDQFHSHPELATQRAIEGARLAQELGAEVFGLGAFWSVVGNKGQDVQDAVPELTVTNGGAYTSGTIKAAIPAMLEHFTASGKDLKESTAAVVGAGGVVAFGIARTIAPQVKKLIMVGRNLERLERLAATLQRAAKDTEIVATVSYDLLPEASIVFTATSDPDPVIFPRHVSPGTLIFDEGRPADVDESVREIEGVRVIPGGVVRPPGDMQTRIDLQFGDGAVPACLAETLIIAATGAHERKSLGNNTKTENINYFVEQADLLGFEAIEG